MDKKPTVKSSRKRVVLPPTADTTKTQGPLIESRPHGLLLRRKAESDAALMPALAAYDAFTRCASSLTITDRSGVARLVRAFNSYRRQVIYLFEAGKNVPQANLRSTMMEEFLGWLFKDVFKLLGQDEPDNFRIGKSNSSYLKLTFAPHSFKSVFTNPNPRISVKDQDFALGAAFELTVSAAAEENAQLKFKVLLPVIAIECKTYLAKNHLDMCASTATDIKRAVPYCMYIVVCEFLKLSRNVSPELSDIAEVYVFCKADNSDRKRRRDAGMPAHGIYPRPVFDLFEKVIGHLRAVWWDPGSALERGKVISRPF